MDETKKKLRWFQRRFARKKGENRGLVDLLISPDTGTFTKIVGLFGAFIAISTLIVAGFATSIPVAMHALLDSYLVSNLLLDSALLLAIALLLTRLILPVLVLGLGLVETWTGVGIVRNTIRKVYVFSWRNGFHASLYYSATAILATVLFLVLSFGLLKGAALALAYLFVLIVSVTLLSLGDILNYMISSKEGVWFKKFKALNDSDPPKWIAVSLAAAVLSVSAFCLGYGIAIKRQSYQIIIDDSQSSAQGAIVGVTSEGMIVYWLAKESAEIGTHSFIPFPARVSSLP